MQALKNFALVIGIFMFAVPAFAQVADDYGTASSGSYCPKLSITMQRGARDVSHSGQVSELQKFLSDYYDIDPDEIVTGFFGRITQGYVQQFQRAQRLPSFGIAGSMTRAIIAKVCTSNTFNSQGSTNSQTNTNTGTTNNTNAGTQNVSVSFVAAPTSGSAPLNVGFYVSGQALSAVSYTIDFGDGMTSSDWSSICESTGVGGCIATMHRYSSAGTYVAKLISGGNTLRTTTITITNTTTDQSTSSQPSISVTSVSLPYIYISYANIANTEVDLISKSSGSVVHNQGISGASGTATIQVQQSLSPGYYFLRVLKKYGDGGTLIESVPFQIGGAQPSLGYSLRILAGNPGDTWYEGSNIDGLALTVSNSSLLTQTLTFPTTCKYTYSLTNESGQVVFDLGSTQYCATSVSSMTLNSGQEYSFPITHQDAQFHLKPGKYVMKATVKDSYGTGTAQTYFYVKAVNPTCTLSAKPYMPAPGEYTTLSWSSQNATSLMWQQDTAANLLGLPASMLSASGAQSFQVSGKSGQMTVTLLVYGTSGNNGSCNTTLSIE